MQEAASQFVCPGGDIILFGGLPEQDNMVQFDSNDIHYRQLRLHGTIGQCRRHYEKVMDILASGKINTKGYITVLPLDEINKGIELTKEGKALKVILHP
jgi:L-iditol 2-dehydrogenase